MKYIGSKIITGEIEVCSGLHIGTDKNDIEIGGMDNPIIRNPLNNEPYIPGSSIKGKMRSLIEMKFGLLSNDGKPCSCGKADCKVCRVFGAANNKKNEGEFRGPTRLLVRDAMLGAEKYKNGDAKIIEEKSENSLNRITAEAIPRPIERVVPGVSFNIEFVFRMYDENDEKYLEEVVFEGMRLLERDYLGGGGSRGNGRIKFTNLKLDGKDFTLEK